jgi:DNA helicase-2/ATP-dependent DNA helicase PcrA
VGVRPNLCVIGDPDQAIYGFRGADPRYFLRFEQDYPGAVTLSLSRNYRSSQAILDAATQVIAKNPDRRSVEILAQFADEVRLDVYRAPTDKAEAEYVVHQIEQMVGGTSYFSLDSARVTGETPATARSFADFVVLYRLSAQCRLLIEAFDRSGIPYQTVGQALLTSYKTVREVLAHLWLLYNPRSQVHVWQVANLPHTQVAFLPKLAQARRAGAAVARLIEQIMAQIVERRRKPYDDADVQRLHQLALRAVPFGDRLADFLEAIALQSETDAYDPRADRVTLMTLHAAKGLEFPVVFIVGCEEGLLPYERKGEPVDVEEERRLFYVGLTRAGRKLILTHARKRVLFGQFMKNATSRFVGDIEAALKEIQEMKYRPPEKKEESKQLSLF